MDGNGGPAYRSQCAANITGILKACVVYSQDNADAFPTTTNAASGYNVYFGTASTDANSVPAAVAAMQTQPDAAGNPASYLWILAVQGSISPKSLLCPQDPNVARYASPVQAAAPPNNFYLAANAPNQLSYSIATPWVTDPATGATVPSGVWRNHGDVSIPMMSDMAPMQGTGSPRRSFAAAPTDPHTVSPANHKGEGMEVGFGDCHVEWCRTPAVGPAADNIFTIAPATGGPWGGTQPTGKTPITPAAPLKDIYMIPVRNLDDNTVH